MPEAPTQKNKTVAIETPLGEDKLLLQSLRGHEELGRLFRFEAEMVSPDPAVDFDKIVGQNVTIRLNLPNGDQRYWNGYVSSFTQTPSDNTLAHYRAIIVPWLWLLTRTADCRIFQDQKIPDIIMQVFKDFGFSQFVENQLTGTYKPWEYCVQYRETAFNFVSRLMEQEGIYYFFRHENGKHMLVLCDTPSKHQPFPKYDNISFNPDRTIQGEKISSWTTSRAVQPARYAHADYNFKKPAAFLGNSGNEQKHVQNVYEIFDYPAEVDDKSEADDLAKIRAQELFTGHNDFSGSTDARGLAVGCAFTMENHFRDDQNRKYLVASAHYSMANPDYGPGSGGSNGEVYLCSFTAEDSTMQYRVQRQTPKPVVQGIQTAVVVGPKGEEIYTDEFGRIKVQFFWDRQGKLDEKSSCWIRVSQSWAGKKWGVFFLPRIGHEVVVSFLEGDPDQPLVTGSVYNKEQANAYALPDEKTKSYIKSNSSPGSQGFNEIRFEDKKGEEQVFIHGEKNMDVRIKNDSFEWIGNNRHLIIKKDQIEHVENNRNEVVDADHMEKIGKDRHLKIVGKEAKEVGGSHSFTVKGDVIEVFKAKHSEQTTSDYYLKADNIVIQGMTHVTVKVGDSFIAIEASGITISGPKIEIEGKATVEAKSPATTVKGDGTLTLKGGMVMIN